MPTYKGFVGSNLDALLIIEASLNHKLPLVLRRPTESERGRLIKLGNIFVFVENLSEIKRWTDGMAWSASRILGRFLIYRALDKSAEKREKRRGRKEYNGEDVGLKIEEKQFRHGFMENHYEISNQLNPNLQNFQCMEYPTFKKFQPSTVIGQCSVPSTVYGIFHDERTAVSSLNKLQEISSDQKPEKASEGSVSTSPSKLTGVWPQNYADIACSNIQTDISWRMPNGVLNQSEILIDEALIKKTISLTVYPDSSALDEKNKQTVHLILYFSAHDVLTGKILRPTQTDLKDITISPRVWLALKRCSLGGKFPPDNEADFFLDSNYQLQKMSALTDQNSERRGIGKSWVKNDCHIDVDMRDNNSNISMESSNRSHTFGYPHSSSAQLMEGTTSLHSQPPMPQMNTLEYPLMNKPLLKSTSVETTSKKRQRQSVSDNTLHYPDSLLDQTTHAFSNPEFRPPNMSSHSSRFLQYTLVSSISKPQSSATFSLLQLTSKLGKPEEKALPPLMGKSPIKFETIEYNGSSIPMYTDNTHILELCANRYSSNFGQSDVNPALYQNMRINLDQHENLGNPSDQPPKYRTPTQKTNGIHTQSPVLQLNSRNLRSTRSFPVLDSNLGSLHADENFARVHDNLSDMRPEQTSNSLSANIAGLGSSDQIFASSDRNYSSNKSDSEMLKNYRLPTSSSCTMAQVSKPHFHTDDF